MFTSSGETLAKPNRRIRRVLREGQRRPGAGAHQIETKTTTRKSNDGPVVVYKAGQNFSEMPGDRHTLDENASKTEPAKLLAVFVVNTDEKELLTPLK
jgi:quercetin dioxygenase-like cupin family protein